MSRISPQSDYLFVTGDNQDVDHPNGDLDRIIIDGGTMGVRQNPNQLRGEDITWLAELLNARYYCLRYRWISALGFSVTVDAAGEIITKGVFSRIVNRSQVNQILNACSQCSTDLFFIGNSVPTNSVYNAQTTFIDVFGQYLWGTTSGQSFGYPQIAAAPAPLRRADLSSAISTFGPNTRYCRRTISAWTPSIATTPEEYVRQGYAFAVFDTSNMTVTETHDTIGGANPNPDAGYQWDYRMAWNCAASWQGHPTDPSLEKWVGTVDAAEGGGTMKICFAPEAYKIIDSFKIVLHMDYYAYGVNEDGSQALTYDKNSWVISNTSYTIPANGVVTISGFWSAFSDRSLTNYGFDAREPSARPSNPSQDYSRNYYGKTYDQRLHLIIKFKDKYTDE